MLGTHELQSHKPEHTQLFAPTYVCGLTSLSVQVESLGAVLPMELGIVKVYKTKTQSWSPADL